MPHTTQSSDFWGWYLRHNSRTVWKYFADAGLDVFAAGPSNNPQDFLDLTNVLPAMNGGFNRRWGIESFVEQNPYTPVAGNAVRMIPYSNPQDSSDPTHTANTNLWMFTDNTQWTVLTDSGALFSGTPPQAFATSGGEAYGVTSRGYFYYSNGINAPRKVNPSYISSSTDTTMGIALENNGPSVGINVAGVLPQASGIGAFTTVPLGSGYGYTVAPTVTVTDAVGSGSGCVITCTLGVHGEVDGFTITNPGANYVQAQATLTAPPAGGRQAYLVLYTQTNASAPKAGQVVGADFGGQINLSSGRQYTVALQNSKTGHTSDVFVGQSVPVFIAGHPTLDALTSAYVNISTANSATVPVYAISTNATAGVTQLEVIVCVPSTGLDSQVDTVVLLAGADGQGLSTLYEVTTIPLASFTLEGGAGGTYAYYYVDTLPDSYNDQTTTGDTLLAADIWAETLSDGSTNGIFLNTPPPMTIKYLTQHQGRLFGTDGKTLFYSKSLDEVTTSTGLITSRWEEAWPGDYQLPVALNNERINSIRSDGTNLHVGTEKNIFTVYGSDPETFSVPAVIFAQTGVLNNDCWSVIYAEGQPAGFLWITPDLKVLHSDFSTYQEVGTPIYPYLQNIDQTKLQYCKVMSLTYGPYNFAILALYLNNSVSGTYFQPDFYIFETRLKKWYHWNMPSYYSGVVLGVNTKSTAPFVYQYPTYTTSGQTPGSRFMFFYQYLVGTGTNTLYIYRFNPNVYSDAFSSNPISWSIKTAWQDIGDSTAIKVANEIEVIGEEPGYTVSLYGANAQSQFDSGGVLLKSGPTVQGPMSALATNKFYTAGASTAAKYYSIQITPVSPSITSPVALTGFSMETYPMARI